MKKTTNNSKGVFQLENGYWGYRFVITVNGKKKSQRRVRNEDGKPFKTEKQTLIKDIQGNTISSLELVNSHANRKNANSKCNEVSYKDFERKISY